MKDSRHAPSSDVLKKCCLMMKESLKMKSSTVRMTSTSDF